MPLTPGQFITKVYYEEKLRKMPLSNTLHNLPTIRKFILFYCKMRLENYLVTGVGYSLIPNFYGQITKRNLGLKL